MKNHTPGRKAINVLGTLIVPALFLAACDDETPVDVDMPQLTVEMSATQFAEADPNVGTDETIMVDVTNTGTGQLTITGVSLGGTGASSFELMGVDAIALGAGATESFEIMFVPGSEGAKAATLFITTDAAADGDFEAALSGTATRFRYTQVDRKGIPALNTVFNHPSGTAGFDKTAYNVASPASDIATYRDQFITVLGAVGNADPEGTADLLLPDELPVSLGASATAFAQLTGRTLSDDATDVALFVTVGDPSLHSDNVDANDVAFRMEFPYVAAPHN